MRIRIPRLCSKLERVPPVQRCSPRLEPHGHARRHATRGLPATARNAGQPRRRARLLPAPTAPAPRGEVSCVVPVRRDAGAPRRGHPPGRSPPPPRGRAGLRLPVAMGPDRPPPPSAAPGPPLCRRRRPAAPGQRAAGPGGGFLPEPPACGKMRREGGREILGVRALIFKASSLFSLRNPVAEIGGAMPPPPLRLSRLCCAEPGTGEGVTKRTVNCL